MVELLDEHVDLACDVALDASDDFASAVALRDAPVGDCKRSCVRASGVTPRLVYRGGSAQTDNLTPRPGIDTTGLSTYDNPAAAAPNGGKVQVIDTSLLKLNGAFPDAPPPGHVSLAPGDAGLIDPWAVTRGTGVVDPLTQDIMDATIDVIRVPKP